MKKTGVLFWAILCIAICNSAVVLLLTKASDEPSLVSNVPERSELLQPGPSVEQPKERREPDFVEIEAVKKQTEDSVYGDIMAHSHERSFGDGNGRATNAHETCHGINSWIRNNLAGKKSNVFYVLGSRGVVLPEPSIRKSQVAKFLPKNLRFYRYNLYIVGQTEWDSAPLYIMDEWTAYVTGAMTNVEDVQTGRYHGEWTDGVSGVLEFSIYSMALAKAVKELTPSYWDSNPNFRKFMIWLLQRAKETYLAGRIMNQFKWDKQDAILTQFLTSNEADDLRKFVAENLDGAWLDVSSGLVQATTYEEYQTSDPKIRLKPHEKTTETPLDHEKQF